MSVFFNKNFIYKVVNLLRFGKLIRMIRRHRNIIISSLTRTLWVDRITVSLYARGQRTPDLIYVAKICYLFSIKLDD